MSVLGTLALMVSAVTARLPKADTPDVEATRLKAQINQLTRELNEARLAAIDARNEANHWATLARRWQARYEMATEPFAQAQALAQANQTQHNAMLAHQYAQMQAQTARNALQTGIPGAQNVNQGFHQFCNCVPARHDLLLSFSHLRLL